uniref:Malate dehydrogenase n=1 Tax=Aceria tosichella TaxID=561515 RepID=A0A6G1SPA8_9ACAR
MSTTTQEKGPIKVLITGSAGQIAYSLIPIVARGDVFGKDQPIVLHLLDIPPMKTVLDGVVMEIEDCSFPLLRGINAYVEETPAFQDIDAAFLVGSMPRKEGMERKDLLAANVKIFKSQGLALANHAKPTVKVLVVGNPANTNAMIAAKYAAPKIPATSFSAMTRLDQNRAAGQLAKRHKLEDASQVKKVIIWGNHSSTQFPDVSNAYYGEKKLPFAAHDPELIELIQKRGAAVIAARKLSSAMSAAKAAADHMHDVWNGSYDIVSMGVVSEGQYGVPAGLFFSFPVQVCPHAKKWKVDESFQLDDFAKEKIAITTKELEEERDEALKACQ